MSTLAAPVVGSLVPLASVAMTLMTQVAREGTAGFWIASGGPKRQFGTGWHAPAVPPQSESAVQILFGSGPLQVPIGGHCVTSLHIVVASWQSPVQVWVPPCETQSKL